MSLLILCAVFAGVLALVVAIALRAPAVSADGPTGLVPGVAFTALLLLILGVALGLIGVS